MKKTFSSWIVLIVANTVIPVYSQILSAASEVSERSQLTQTRVQIESEFALKEAVCYKSFAVESCLRQLHTEKRASLAVIKSQELAAHDLQRQKKKAEFEQKASKPSSANRPVVEATIPDRATGRSLEQQKKITDAGKRVQKTNQKTNASKLKAAQRLQKSNLADQERAKYQNKLRAADEHKAAIEEKKTLMTKPKAASLPLPE